MNIEDPLFHGSEYGENLRCMKSFYVTISKFLRLPLQ